MTVKELKEILAPMDDNLIVLEENAGELRELLTKDIEIDRNDGDWLIHLADGDEIKTDVLIFGAWS